ncbi:flavin reductase family protein [Afifella sp. IM 167]|uniref:flavin reductase family protein n=1 Tax=Afifella sp. IM 167 TaxID=2033586 RepID=UPI001CCA4686|nr:flavin reductase family protein [Afifella sp. IM 167]MBZ8132900.1 flavin oxidoreductase [Afifella sp. IM 167]
MDQTALPAIDPKLFRSVMSRFASGVTVIAAETDAGVRAMTANAFLSGSMNPPLAVVAVARKARMHAVMEAAGRYTISFLSREQEPLSNLFAGRPAEDVTSEFIDFHGAKVLKGAIAHILADPYDRHDCGDHSLFLGHIRAMEAFEGEPLLYYASAYHHLATEPEGAAHKVADFW